MRYEMVKQKPFCCVPACITMILDRRGIAHGSQEDIGYALGLAVPESHQKQFPHARTEMPTSGWGTEIQREEYSIASFFDTEHIALIEEYVTIDDVNDVCLFLGERLAAGDDVIVCFNNKAVFGEGDWGHVSLVDEINGDCVVLVEPEVGLPDTREVDIAVLADAMRIHGVHNRAGFWIIRKK